MRWEKEVQEEQEEWLDHLVWKGKEEGLAGMEKEDCLAHLVQKVNLVSRDFQVLLDPKETEDTREMLDRKEMMDLGE